MAFRIISEFVGPSNASGFVQDACETLLLFLPTGGGLYAFARAKRSNPVRNIFLSSESPDVEQAAQATTQDKRMDLMLQEAVEWLQASLGKGHGRFQCLGSHGPSGSTGSL